MTKWTVRISSRLYLAVVLPPNTELTRTFSLSFGNKTFWTLPVSEWVTDWVTRANTSTRFYELVNYYTYYGGLEVFFLIFWIFQVEKITLIKSVNWHWVPRISQVVVPSATWRKIKIFLRISILRSCCKGLKSPGSRDKRWPICSSAAGIGPDHPGLPLWAFDKTLADCWHYLRRRERERKEKIWKLFILSSRT